MQFEQSAPTWSAEHKEGLFDKALGFARRLRVGSAKASCFSARVLLALSPHVELPRLTPRELESLRWTMEGKTAWEVGNILGISEQTAARHLSNATRKLDCVNKLQAVVKALRLGLIR